MSPSRILWALRVTFIVGAVLICWNIFVIENDDAIWVNYVELPINILTLAIVIWALEYWKLQR